LCAGKVGGFFFLFLMQQPHKKRQHEADDTTRTLAYLLADKERRGLSWHDWEAEHRVFDAPILRHKLQDSIHSLLSQWPVAFPLLEVVGAALPLRQHLELYLRQYTSTHRVHLPRFLPVRSLLFKFSADGRVITHTSNQGLYYQLLTVYHPQSPAHVVTHCAATLAETAPAVATVYHQSTITQLLPEIALGRWRSNWRGEELLLDYIYSADWMIHVAQLALEQPNADEDDSVCCWLCRRTKRWTRDGWRSQPFQFVPIERTHADFAAVAQQYPMAAAVDLARRRYCWGHGIARLLSNLLSTICNAIDDQRVTQLAECVRRSSTAYKWTAGGSLSMKDAKLLLDAPDFMRTVPELVRDATTAPCRLLLPGLSSNELLLRELTAPTVVQLLLASIATVKDFAYARWPARQSFRVLWRARNALLSAYAANDLPLAPSEHFLLHHGIELALRDRTAFFTVQEAIEHKHKSDRADAEHTSHSRKRTDRSTRSFLEQMLDHQELRRILDVVDNVINQRDYDLERLTYLALRPELSVVPDLPLPDALMSLNNQVSE